MPRIFDGTDPELMDRPQQVSTELEQTLRELEFLNRHFGGQRYLRGFLSRQFVPRREAYRVLDLGTGGGDLPRAIVNWANRAGVLLRIDAVDASPAILSLAKRFSRSYPQINYRLGDARTFDLGETYDLVHCSLALHHFSDAEAARLLRHARALSHGFVLITDLERSWFTRVGVHFINLLLRHRRMTKIDGDTSALRAFSFEEMEQLAERAGWKHFGHERFLFCRQALWLPAEMGDGSTK
jgi:SAM-dependent methyltransferase